MRLFWFHTCSSTMINYSQPFIVSLPGIYCLQKQPSNSIILITTSSFLLIICLIHYPSQCTPFHGTPFQVTMAESFNHWNATRCQVLLGLHLPPAREFSLLAEPQVIILKYDLRICFLATNQAPTVAVQIPLKGDSEMEITTQELFLISSLVEGSSK